MVKYKGVQTCAQGECSTWRVCSAWRGAEGVSTGHRAARCADAPWWL